MADTQDLVATWRDWDTPVLERFTKHAGDCLIEAFDRGDKETADRLHRWKGDLQNELKARRIRETPTA